MRAARVKTEGPGYYHIMSRIIERRMVMGEKEKEKFRKMMRAVSEFCGVQVLTYAALDNHFHLLVHVPVAEPIDDVEFSRRLGLVYSREVVKAVTGSLKEIRKNGSAEGAEQYKKQFTYRMYEVSEFMKMLKQRYSQWYNRRENRRGPLWEQRFKSILVEGSEKAITTMAAYIDLNAIRAGIVEDPKDYRFCGYGEAVAGNKVAREGLLRVMQAFGWKGTDWRAVGAAYRKYLFQRGEESGVTEAGTATKPGISRERVQQVVAENGKLSLADALRCKVRYFTDGMALGSKEFVDDVFKKHRDQFGAKRKNGARAMKWSEWGGLCTARDLRLEVVSVSAG